MLICVTVLILKLGLFNYFHIGNVNIQNNVDEPGPQLVVEPPPQGLFRLSGFIAYHLHGLEEHVRQSITRQSEMANTSPRPMPVLANVHHIKIKIFICSLEFP